MTALLLTCTGPCGGTQRPAQDNEHVLPEPGYQVQAWCAVCKKVLPHLVGLPAEPKAVHPATRKSRTERTADATVELERLLREAGAVIVTQPKQ